MPRFVAYNQAVCCVQRIWEHEIALFVSCPLHVTLLVNPAELSIGLSISRRIGAYPSFGHALTFSLRSSLLNTNWQSRHDNTLDPKRHLLARL